MITLFATPKNFTGIFKIIQQNALRSWRALSPDIQIIIMGDSQGSCEMAEEIGAEFIPNIRCSKEGVPLLSDLFRQAEKKAKFSIMTFINADIILPVNFLNVVKVAAQRFNQFLMVGHRWDMDVEKLIDFSDETKQNKFWKEVKINSIKHPCTGIDYFVYKRYQWDKIPDFTIGRPGYDNWIIWKARRKLIPVVDASESIMAAHQNHHFNFHNLKADPKIVFEADGIMNRKLVEGRFSKKLRVLNILDSTYKISNYKVYKKNDIDSRSRFWHRLPTVFPEFSFFIKIYRRYLLKYLSKKNNSLLK